MNVKSCVGSLSDSQILDSAHLKQFKIFIAGSVIGFDLKTIMTIRMKKIIKILAPRLLSNMVQGY